MSEEFSISTAMTKAQLIEQHEKLLDAYRAKVREAQEAQKKRAEAEKQAEVQAVKVAKEATVAGVIENLGQLRGLVGKTLNDLVERMTGQAERLEALNHAIEVQQARLKELHDIEAAADSMATLVQAYEERRAAAEAELTGRIAALEEEYRGKARSLEEQHALRVKKLEEEQREARAAWDAERAHTERELAETAAERAKAREREEAEYVYERDRARKIEEHEYVERRAAAEKDLTERIAGAERDLAAREAAVAAKEHELGEARRQLAELPQTVEREAERARKDARAVAVKEAEQKAELIAVQHEWAAKMLEERIAHLQENLKARDEKLAELKADLDRALKQVQQIAEKTVEGASLTKAFQTVNQIALEQARRPEKE